jgi:hypothetical protein
MSGRERVEDKCGRAFSSAKLVGNIVRDVRASASAIAVELAPADAKIPHNALARFVLKVAPAQNFEAALANGAFARRLVIAKRLGSRVDHAAKPAALTGKCLTGGTLRSNARKKRRHECVAPQSVRIVQMTQHMHGRINQFLISFHLNPQRFGDAKARPVNEHIT